MHEVVHKKYIDLLESQELVVKEIQITDKLNPLLTQDTQEIVYKY
jgi:hypothetical protein